MSGEDRTGRLVARFKELSDADPAAARTMIDGLAPADREAVQDALLLEGIHASLVMRLWDALAPGVPKRIARDDPLLQAEREMVDSLSATFDRMAWKFALHLEGHTVTPETAEADVAYMLAEDPEFRELAESVATYTQWYGANAKE